MNYDSNGALLQTEVKSFPLINRGKVRDIYDLGDSLLFVATDRISAFDFVMPNGIPNKGKILTQISLFWFELLNWQENHLLTADFSKFPKELQPYKSDLDGRSIIVKKAEPLPIECIVRGYLIGSGWKDYQKTGKVCGINLRENYQQAAKLDESIFTPSTKAEQGLHDENISFERTVEIIGQDLADKIKNLSLKIYNTAADYAKEKGIILADTKFEFGLLNNELILIDEVLTPDSSRFWPASDYKLGCSPPSLDKQFVRDYLESCGWKKTPPAPELPKDIVENTSKKYLEAYKTLTGKSLL
ncbi:MAG TPA: phosphoribosylaminoimidazolesuccinocarboxamide synthase [Victivallales bacterium]|nr:phosphoribosylaminoimidazolesuccinocarboxamide synthase [Victivallales bacterium]